MRCGSWGGVFDATSLAGATSAGEFECDSRVSGPETLIVGLSYARPSVKT